MSLALYVYGQHIRIMLIENIVQLHTFPTNVDLWLQFSCIQIIFLADRVGTLRIVQRHNSFQETDIEIVKWGPITSQWEIQSGWNIALTK